MSALRVFIGQNSYMYIYDKKKDKLFSDRNSMYIHFSCQKNYINYKLRFSLNNIIEKYQFRY